VIGVPPVFKKKNRRLVVRHKTRRVRPFDVTGSNVSREIHVIAIKKFFKKISVVRGINRTILG
jgi:hypothetical protein